MTFDIFLVRHGEPDCDQRARLSRQEFVDWLADYSVAGVSRPPLDAAPCRAAARCVRTILASGLTRARDSAVMLASDRAIQTDEIYNEAPIAIAHLGFSLRPWQWITIGRLLWLAGAVSQERLINTKRRAAVAAQKLLAEAETASVMLVGHGWMNRMIADVLKQHGMRVVQRTGLSYWSMIRLSKCGK